MRDERFQLVTVESDFGAGKKGAALGPPALIGELKARGFDLVDLDDYLRLIPEELPAISDTPYGKNIENITLFQSDVCNQISGIVARNRIPFILSGDHSSANGLISGIKDHYANSRIGVIWVDAHADLHSPYTTPSGNVHGMPIAALMGDDHREMGRNDPREITRRLWETLKRLGRRRITPKIQGPDIVFISLRSTETEEEKIIAKEDIRTFRPDTIRELGIREVASRTLTHLKDCEFIYVSFDVDSMDPSLSEGTGTPVNDGLSMEEAEILLRIFVQQHNLAGFEVTEINPQLDEKRPMQGVIADLLMRIFNSQ